MSFTKEEEKQIGKLQTLCNKYGDFKITIANKKPNGETFWTKHKSVMQCWEEGEKGFWFMSKANNRQILPHEFIIDLDEKPTKEKMDKICDDLEKLNSKYEAYHTGSKGYHVHVYDKELGKLDNRTKKIFYQYFLTFLKADIMKASPLSMIAMENMPHWKTGKTKKLIRTNITKK